MGCNRGLKWLKRLYSFFRVVTVSRSLPQPKMLLFVLSVPLSCAICLFARSWRQLRPLDRVLWWQRAPDAHRAPQIQPAADCCACSAEPAVSVARAPRWAGVRRVAMTGCAESPPGSPPPVATYAVEACSPEAFAYRDISSDVARECQVQVVPAGALKRLPSDAAALRCCLSASGS